MLSVNAAGGDSPTIGIAQFRAKQRAFILLAVLAGIFGLAGCGGSGEGRDGAASPTALSDPFSGSVPERTHYLPVDRRTLDPPLREAWSIHTHVSIDFPPIVANGVAYVADRHGHLSAVRLSDSKILWERGTYPSKSGPPTEMTAPLYSGGRLFLAFVDGKTLAVDAASGRLAWKFDLNIGLDASPVVADQTLYVISLDRNLLALNARTGDFLSEFNELRAIKSSPSFHDGRIFLAGANGTIFCVEAEERRICWQANTTKAPPFGRGGFHSSPAIAFGHVYAVRDDGTVFSFDEKSGRAAWSFPVKGHAYGSPAVARVAGTPPSVYVGSSSGRFYALDALSGRLRWHHDFGGPVSGTPVVIGHTVYVSSTETGETIGIDVRTHRKTFELRGVGDAPVVSDGRHLYTTGRFELIGLEPEAGG